MIDRQLTARDYGEAMRRTMQCRAPHDPASIMVGLISIMLDEPITDTENRFEDDPEIEAVMMSEHFGALPLPDEAPDESRWQLRPSVHGLTSIALRKRIAMYETMSNYQSGYLRMRDLIGKRLDPPLDPDRIDDLPLLVFEAMWYTVRGLPLQGITFR